MRPRNSPLTWVFAGCWSGLRLIMRSDQGAPIETKAVQVIRLPDHAWGRTVRARRRVAVRGRPGDVAGGPDADGRAPVRARRDVRGAGRRERGRSSDQFIPGRTD